MLPYITVFLMLWCLFVTRCFGIRLKHNIDYYLVLITLFLFVSLRYRTGYDWDGYEQFFGLLKEADYTSIIDVLSLSAEYGKEPLFGILVNFAANVGLDYYFVQFLAAAVLFKGTASLLKLFPTPLSRAFGLALVFSLFGYSLFFSAIKQSFAVGLFLMYVVASHERRSVSVRLLLAVCAIFFQYSALIYFVIFHLSSCAFSWRRHAMIFLFSCVTLIGNLVIPGFVGMVIYKLVTFILPFNYVITKASWYFFERNSGVTMTGLVTVLFFHLLWGWALLNFTSSNRLDRFGHWAFGFFGYFVAFQSIFVHYSVFTNRLLYVAIYFISAVYFYPVFKKYVCRRALLTLIFFYSLSYYMLFLMSASARPFIPYKSYSAKNVAEPFESAVTRLMDYHIEKAEQ